MMRRTAAALAGLAVLTMSGGAATGHASAAPPASLPMVTSSVKVGATTYQYTMVGRNPTTPGTGTTTVSVPIVPVEFVFPGGLVRDPTVADPTCFGGTKPIDRILPSPLFANRAYTWGGTS